MIELKEYLMNEDGLQTDVMEFFHMDDMEQFNYGYRNSDFFAWDRCFKKFQQSHFPLQDEDIMVELCFSLIGYLDAWGMYDRKAVLAKNKVTCKEFKKVVNCLLNQKEDLAGVSFDQWEEKKDIIQELYQNLKKMIPSATETLCSKILLGTLACVPAFDVNVEKSFRECRKCPQHEKIYNLYSTISNFTDKVNALVHHCRKINLLDVPIAKRLKNLGQPDMKIADFCFFFYGKHIISENKKVMK